MLGVFTGSDASGLGRFEEWLGRKVDFCTVFTGEASDQDFLSSPLFEVDRFQRRPVIWSIPLIYKGADLKIAARGDYDHLYRSVAYAIMLSETPSLVRPRVMVRTGWEQNGSWMTWTAVGKEAAFVSAFRRFVKVFRDVSSRFQFVWCPNIGQSNPSMTYPGDAYVDVIGLDVYHQPEWDPRSPTLAWAYMVTRPFGLQWHLEFARSRKKPLAFPEWGVSSDGFESYVINMARWIKSSELLFHSYWESNAEYPGALSGGQHRDTGEAFRQQFGCLSRP